MKNWSLVFILAAGLLCLPVCAAQPKVQPAPQADTKNQAVDQNEISEEARDAEDSKKDLAEAQREAQEEAAEAQREAQEEAEEARREALEDAKEAQEDALEAQKDMQEGLKEAQKGLLEAQKELRNAGINIALPRITGTSMNMFAATNTAEKAGAVLIVPDKAVNAKTMGELTEDMQVMAVVLEDKVGQNKTGGAQGYGGSGGVWLNIFGSSSPQPRAVYLGGYGMMFTMDVDFPLVLIKGAEEKTQDTTQEKKDEVWQRSKSKLKGEDQPADKNKDKDKEPALVFDPEKVKQLQKDLTAALKHASNIRNLEPREKIIVVVRSVVDGEVLSLVVPETAGAQQEKEPVSVQTSVMTLRADKQDIDAFAAEKISFDKFAEKVSVVIY